jgi:hypothetical protein
MFSWVEFNDSGESYIDDVIVQQETRPIAVQSMPVIAARNLNVILRLTSGNVYGRKPRLPDLPLAPAITDEHYGS